MILRHTDLPVIRSLANGRSFTMAADLAAWTPDERLDFLRRTGLRLDDVNGKPALGPFVTDLAHRLVTWPCQDERCGEPQHGPGHPRRGWVRIHLAGDRSIPNRWFCCWSCAATHCRQEASA